MSKRLEAAQPYLPVKGVNFDSNSLDLDPQECTHIRNLRILPFELRTRGGSRRIATNVPSGDPILHFHTYKVPNGGEIQFGFTKNCIYKLNAADGTWSSVFASTEINDCDNGANFAANAKMALGQFTLPGIVYEGTGLIRVGDIANTQTMAIGDVFLSLDNIGPLDLTAATHISFWHQFPLAPNGTAFSNGSLSLTLSTYAGNGFTTLIESVNFTISVPSNYGNWVKVSIPITSASYGVFKSFKITWNEAGTQRYNAYIDYIIAERFLTNDVTFWSTTDIVDNVYGSTVIAAGSNPPKPTDPEDDGSERVLLYYNITSEHFKTLTQYTVLQKEESTNVSGGGTNPGPHTGTVSTIPLVPFGFNLTSGGLRLFDDGNGNLTGDGSGTINYTTGTWNALFSEGVGIITANYLYKLASTAMPRYVKTYANRLCMLSTYQSSVYYPWRMAWTDVADITTFRNTSYKDTVENDISPIVAATYIGEYLCIYKEDSVIKVRNIGGDATFGFFTVWHQGIFAHKCVVEYNNNNILLGTDDVYFFDGNQFLPISTNRIRNKLFELLNVDRIQYCFGSINDKYKEYWLWIVTSGNNYPTSVFVYTITKNCWSYFTFSQTTALGKFYTQRGVTIDDLVGTIDQQNWTLDGGLLEGTIRTNVMALSTGDCFALDDLLAEDYIINGVGTAISFELITKDFIYESLPHKDRTQRMHVEGQGVDVTVGESARYIQDVAMFDNKQTLVLGVGYEEAHYWPDKVNEHLRFSFEGSGSVSLRWIQPFSIKQELD